MLPAGISYTINTIIYRNICNKENLCTTRLSIHGTGRNSGKQHYGNRLTNIAK